MALRVKIQENERKKDEVKEMSLMIPMPLDIPNVRVLDVEMKESGDVIVTVESTIEGTKCRKCGKEITESRGKDKAIMLRHLPSFGRRAYIRIEPKRYICRNCSDNPTTTQKLEWYEARSPNTKAYEDYLLLQIIGSTVQDVSLKEKIGYDTVEGTIERRISNEVNWDEYKKIGVLGLDEIAIKKGHRDFVAVITSQQADGRVKILAILADRKKETVKEFIKSIPAELKKTIHTVCSDMYEGYINAAKEELPDSVIVVDRFHVAKHYRDSADQLRKEELRRLKKELPKEEYEKLNGAMWAFRKNRVDLEKDEKPVLRLLFKLSPDLKKAYGFREELTNIFEQKLSKAKATRKINNWQKRVRASGLTCFDSFFKTLDNWIDEITNYFINRYTSGFVEGINNKIKVIKRRCYGITNFVHFFQRIFLDIEGYRLFSKSYC